MSNSNLSQNKKAREARRWRATNTARKRFDLSLREFVKIKYEDIYNEYSEFYNRLNIQYSNVRNLTTTYMFRKWVKGVQQHKSQQTPNELEIPDESAQQESQSTTEAVQQESQSTTEAV